MKRNLVLSKHWSAGTFFDLSLLCLLELRDGYRPREVLKQAQDLFCLRELVVSSNSRSEPKTARKPFFLKSHLKVEKVSSWHFEGTTNLILVDTSWHWVDTALFCTGAQQVVGVAMCTYTQSIWWAFLKTPLAISCLPFLSLKKSATTKWNAGNSLGYQRSCTSFVSRTFTVLSFIWP